MEELNRHKIDTTKLPEMLTAKWRPELLEEGFVPYPKKLLRVASEIFVWEEGFTDMLLLLAIVDFQRPHLTRNPSMEYLGFLSGLTVDEVNDSLDRMQNKGLITWEDDGKGVVVSMDGLFYKVSSTAIDQDLKIKNTHKKPAGMQAAKPLESNPNE